MFSGGSPPRYIHTRYNILCQLITGGKKRRCVFNVTGSFGLTYVTRISLGWVIDRACLQTHIPGSPGNETKRVGQRTDVCIRFRRPKDPAVQRGGVL